MEILHKNILKDIRTKIVIDMDVRNGVINTLRKEDVLKIEDIERIMQEPTKSQRAEVLLDILPRDEDAIDTVRYNPECPILSFQPPTVTRVKKVRELKTALEKLTPGGYLALHGMKGFGKSSLTKSTLTDEALVSRHFKNQIHWIKFGNRSSIQDEISIQLNRLYHQLAGSSDNVNSIHNSDSLKQHNFLESHFGKNNHREALLILEDVWSKEIIEAFDFSCKTLVITSDLHILDDKDPRIIQMKDGFTEAESLELFAKVLNIDVNNLPPEAKRIHELCYGRPMVISMLAGLFKKFEDMDTNRDRWLYYLNSLRTKDSSNKAIEKMQAKLEITFNMCIERLTPDAEWKFKSLAIFDEDVNITTKTLQIYWNENNLCQVDDHMLDLYEKSLVVRHLNTELNSYTYALHESAHNHLKQGMPDQELKNFSRLLIKRYRKFCHDDFSKLPDDNYSFSYIGYHLEQSEMFDEFPKIYLDFDFLREKIYHSGLSDLLADLTKYRRYISGDTEDSAAKVVDLEKLLKSQAGIIVDHKLRKCLDLVQIGLNYSETGFIGQHVRKLASKQSSKLYVTYDKRYGSYEVPASLETVTDMTEAVFFNNPNKILIGNSSGEVMLWNCETHEHSLFLGKQQNDRNSIIRKIIVSNNGDYFLTLSDSGQVNLFNVMNEEQISSGTSNYVQTPRDKQSSWVGICGDKVCRNSSHFTISILGEIINDMALSVDEHIGICTDSGTIEVWTIDGLRMFTIKVAQMNKKQSYENFKRVTFTEKKMMLQVMNVEGTVTFYSEKYNQMDISKRYGRVFLYSPRLEEQSFVLFQPLPRIDKCLVIVTNMRPYYITWHEFYDKTDFSRVECVYSPSVRMGVQVSSVKSLITCAALTDDGKYLVTGHPRSTVTVWRAHGSSEAIATFSGHVTSLDTCWLNEGHHLICGSGNRVIYRWSLSLENLPVKRTVFDAVVKPWGELNIVAKESSRNTVKIYCGNSMVAETEPIVGTVTDLSLNSEGNKVAYASSVEATQGGMSPGWYITVFDIETKESTAIFKLTARPKILRFLTVDGISGVLCGEDSQLRMYYGTILSSKPLSSLVVENENVVSIHVVNNSYVICLMRNGVKIWRVNKMAWWTNFSQPINCDGNDTMAYSCLAPDEKSLTILTANGAMIIYDVVIHDSVDPAQIELSDPLRPLFDQKISCCEYSQDNKYLAVGLENGGISIFHIFGQRVVGQLDLHCNEVLHLRWSMTSIGSQILLSANRDELAWWNLSSVFNETAKPGGSRKGPYRTALWNGSGTNPTPSTSQSSCATSSAQDPFLQSSNDKFPENHDFGYQDNNNSPQLFWKTKTAKYSNKNTLLSVVPLPPTCKTKLYVSKDFSKLLFVDIHGSVCHSEFINYT